MSFAKFILKFVIFLIPFGTLALIPVAIEELVPIQWVVAQQQNSEQPFVYGPQFVWRDNLFAYRVESINYRKPEILVLGSSRTTNIRSNMFDKNPRSFYNASVEGFNLPENEQLLYAIDEDALPQIILLGLNQNLFKTENVSLEVNRPTKKADEILIDEIVLNTILQTYQDIATDGRFVRNSFIDQDIFEDSVELFGSRVKTFGIGYLADGSTRIRIVEQWSAKYINQETQKDYKELEQREGKFRPGEATNSELLQILENILRYADQRNITVIGFAPPFAPDFYNQMVASNDFDFIADANNDIKPLFERYNGQYFDFTNPFYFSLGDRNFRDSWHASDRVLAQIYQIIDWSMPELFEEYTSLDLLSQTIDQNTNPYYLYLEDGEYVNPATDSAVGQLIKDGVEPSEILLDAAKAYNQVIYSNMPSYEASIQIITEAIDQYPETTVLKLWRAEVYSYTNETDLLVRDVQQALQLDPTLYVPDNLSVKYVEFAGEDAQDVINQVLSENSDAGWAYLIRAKIRFGEARFIEARDDYLRAYQIDGSLSSFDGYVDSLIELESYDTTISFLSAFIDDTPKSIQYLERRATIYTLNEQYDLAIADYQLAYDLSEGKNTFFFVKQGDVYLQAEMYEQAVKTYTTSIDLFEDSGFIYARRGEAYMGLGNVGLAIDNYKTAILLSPDNIEGYVRLMDYYESDSDFANAIDIVTEAINFHTDQAWLYAKRAKFNRQLENYSIALADYLLIQELEPENYANYYFVGDMYYQLEDFDSAIPWLEKSINSYPDNENGYRRLADIYEQRVEYNKAIEILNRGIENHPDIIWLYKKRADLNRFLGNNVSAINDYKVVIENDPGDGLNYYRVGNLYQLVGQIEEATLWLQRAVEIDPTNVSSFSRLADIYEEQSNFVQAESIIAQAIQRHPEQYWLYNRHARYSIELNNYNDAILDYSVLLNIEPQNISYYIKIAELYMELNQFDNATIWINKALQIDSTSVSAQRLRNKNFELSSQFEEP